MSEPFPGSAADLYERIVALREKIARMESVSELSVEPDNPYSSDSPAAHCGYVAGWNDCLAAVKSKDHENNEDKKA